MKKHLLYLALCSTLLWSCSEDEGVEEPTSDFVGTWELADVSYSGISYIEYLGSNYEQSFTSEGFNYDATMTATENPNEVETEGSYSVSFTVELYGIEIPYTSSGIDLVGQGTWDIEGDQLTVVSEEQEIVFSILTLTPDSCKLAFNSTINPEVTGMTVEQTVEGTITYTK